MPVLRDKARRNEIRREFYSSMEEHGLGIPESVKTLRKMLAMDQKTFCQYVGISLSALRRIEQSGGNVTLATIRKILDKFGLELHVVAK